MASTMKAIRSQESINVSYNYTTPSTSRSRSPATQKAPHQSHPIVLIDDSLKDTAQAMPTPAAPSVNSEDDLYGVSPERDPRSQRLRSSQYQQQSQRVPASSLEQNSQTSNGQRTRSQAAALATAELAVESETSKSEAREGATTPATKLKVLTQNASDDEVLRPAFTTSAAAESAHSNGKSNSQASRKPSVTSQTSAMASTRKAEPTPAAKTSAQTTGKRSSALNALRAKNGLEPKTQPPPTASASVPTAPVEFKKAKSQGAKANSKALSPPRATKANEKRSESNAAASKPPVTKTLESQVAGASTSPGRRRALRGSDQAETSRIETADSPRNSPLRDPAQSPVYGVSNEPKGQTKGKLKKVGASNKGKGKEREARYTAVEEEESTSKAGEENQAQSEPTQDTADQDGSEDDEDPVRPSQERKRGKGALKSKPKTAAGTGRKQADGTYRPSGSEYELKDSSSPKAGGRSKIVKPQMSKKSAPAAKAAPKSKTSNAVTTGTSRTTRAQAAAATKLQQNNQTNDEHATSPHAGTKTASPPPRDKLAQANTVKQKKPKVASPAKQLEEPENGLEAVVEEPRTKKPAVKEGKGKSNAPSKPAARHSPRHLQSARGFPSDALGGTQDTAIELSDDNSSSSIAGSPVRSPDTGRDSRETAAVSPNTSRPHNVQPRPHTPANFRSSPPLVTREDDQQDHAASATARSRKTQIVGFDKHGPRNQGTLSGKTPARNDRSSVAPTKVPLASSGGKSRMEANRRKRASSVATSTRTTRSNRPAPAGNVALDVNDALAGLSRKPGKENIVASASKQLQPEVSHQEPDPQLHDDGYVNIDDFEGQTLVNAPIDEQQASKAVSLDRTQSQIAMPPPGKKPAAGKKPIEPPVQDTAVEPAAADRQTRGLKSKRPRSPEPPPERSSKRAKATHVDEDVGRESREPASAKSVQGTSRKRARAPEPEVEASGKRHKLAAEAITKHRDNVSQIANGKTTVGEGSNAKRNAGQRGSTSKRPTRTAQRALPRRQTSQGSQTVDMTGSPVPPDMEVTGESTVLETYSQQADLAQKGDFSPDVSSESDEMMRQQRKTSNAGVQRSDDADPFRLPPSHQTGVLSSNVKPRPAAPNAESNIVPRVHSRDLDLIQQHDPLADTEDPFNLSQEDRQAASNESADAFPRWPVFAKQSDFFGGKVEYQDPVKKSRGAVAKAPTPPNQPRAETTSVFRSTQRQIQKLRRINAPRQREVHVEVEDPDKTLVNEVDEGEGYGFSDEGAENEEYDVVKEPGFNASRADVDHELSEIDQDHMMSWCNTLKPHQLDMFDELVKCSYRIAAFFAERENNIERTLERQHGMGLHVIQQDEFLRAKEYEQVKENLARAKDEIKQEYQQSLKQYEQQRTDRRLERSRRIVEKGKRDDENNKLEALIAGLA